MSVVFKLLEVNGISIHGRAEIEMLPCSWYFCFEQILDFGPCTSSDLELSSLTQGYVRAAGIAFQYSVQLVPRHPFLRPLMAMRSLMKAYLRQAVDKRKFPSYLTRRFVFVSNRNVRSGSNPVVSVVPSTLPLPSRSSTVSCVPSLPCA
jgi:hypothetical protein